MRNNHVDRRGERENDDLRELAVVLALMNERARDTGAEKKDVTDGGVPYSRTKVVRDLFHYNDTKQYSQTIYICKEISLLYSTLLSHITGYQYQHARRILRRLADDGILIPVDKEAYSHQLKILQHAREMSPDKIDTMKPYMLNPQVAPLLGLMDWDNNIPTEAMVRLSEHQKALRQAEEDLIRQKERARLQAEKQETQRKKETAIWERKRELLSRAEQQASAYLEAGRERLREQDYERYRNIYVFMRHLYMYADAARMDPEEILEKHLPPGMVRAIREVDVEAIVGFYTDREATRRLAQTSQALQHALNSILTAGEDAVI